MIHPKVMNYVCKALYSSPTNIRGCIQHGLFDWAVCMKPDGSRNFSYFIRPEPFRQEFGVSLDDIISGEVRA